MSPVHSLRTMLATALSLSLLVALIALPGATLAATPSWERAGSDLLPSIVKTGSAAGYSASVKNNGPSNIPSLSVTAFFQQPYSPVTDDTLVSPPVTGPVPVYAAVFKNGIEVSGGCASLSFPLMCNLGSLSAGEAATIVVAYQPTGVADAGIHGWWQTSGTGSSFCTESDNSRGDCLPFHVGPTTISNSGDRGGGFALNAQPVTTDAISASNLTFTSMDPLREDVANLIATVADDNAVIDPGCPAAFAPCAALPTSELHLGDGTATFGMSKVVIEFHKTALKGVNFGKLNVIHIHDGGLITAHEVPKAKFCDGTAECAMFENLAGGHGRVTIYAAQNGWVKYH